MKFYLPILLLFSICGFSQQVVVEYYENPIVNNQSEIAQLPKSLQKNFEPNRFAYTLIYKDGFSTYENQDYSHLVEEEEEIEQMLDLGDEEQVKFVGKTMPSPLQFQRFEKVFYKDYFAKKIHAKLFIGNKKEVVDDFFDWNWEITDDEKNINGYLCKKAITRIQGYYFEAWFTQEIPISAGPEKFDGLPGLILYVNTGGVEFIAKSISFPEVLKPIEQPKFDGQTLTFDQVYSKQSQDVPKIKTNLELRFDEGSNKGEKRTVRRVY